MHPKQFRSWRAAPSLALAGAAALIAYSDGAAADVALPPVTVGVGLQTSLYDCDKACIYSPSTVPSSTYNPDTGATTPGETNVQGAALNSVRLYVNGSVTDQIKLTFDTEYTGTGSGNGADKVEVLDAVGRFEFNSYLNIWAGRFLEPSDRANLYGPYYANDWTPFADGVADYYPGIENGRDNGVAYWGDFGGLKAQIGAFDGETSNSAVPDKSKLLWAGRLTYDFWEKESGYYFNGTYYGDKDILALGIAGQTQNSANTWSLDGLLEKKLSNLGAFTIEAEYNHDDRLTGSTESYGWYGLAAYIFPQVIGIGKFQVLGKYSEKTVESLPAEDQIKTTEVDLNYIIKEFNARVGFYYLNQTDKLLGTSPNEYGIKLQLQM